MPTSLEVCAGGGGTALGLERAGFRHVGLVELNPHSCETLRLNRPQWNVIQMDLREFSAVPYRGTDLLSGGIPCPPFSKAGMQLGELDERDLFPEMIRLASECEPQAIMIENVRGLLDEKLSEYRKRIEYEFEQLGFEIDWRILNASHFRVPQLRPRVVMVGMRSDHVENFQWPRGYKTAPTVGEALYEEMSSRGWEGAKAWSERANRVAPTLVGGSEKHGGPDLGPTRARMEWARLGVDGGTLAEEPPEEGFTGQPRLTVRMAAQIQGFPPDWQFHGKKTPAYRQVGNAFPPPVAAAVARKLRQAIRPTSRNRRKRSRAA